MITNQIIISKRGEADMIDTDNLKDIANEYGTPAYVFDIDELTERINMIGGILGQDITLCYAMKANPFLVDAMKPLINKYEVCSPGEFAICERENIDMNRIVLSGVNKEQHDIEHVMDDCGGVGIYTIESLNQLQMLSDCADMRKKTIAVLLRVTSGNQFGLDEKDIEEIISNRDNYKYVDFRGIQCYSGTQKKKIAQIEKEIDWLDGICENLNEKYGYQVKELEYGPGLPVSYFCSDADNNYEMLEQFSDKLNSIRGKYDITLEMGRYLVATCGVFITRIADMKINNEQNYCIIDGGINHINYYGQTMAMKIPQIDFVHMSASGDIAQDRESNWTICGSLCTVGDVIVKNLPLKNPAIGDMLVFYNIGAYSVTEGIYLFLSRKMPVIINYSAKSGAVVLREGLASDIINSRKILLD